MTNGFYATNLARFRAETARQLGCDESAFDSNALTVVPRPASSRYNNLALVGTFGTGTVVAVEPSYVEWVQGHTPERHFLAMRPSEFLTPLLIEAERRGDRGLISGTTRP